MSEAQRSLRSIEHVAALDGLRGVALLGVLFFHANGALRGGYLGVDLFFVLSGYLITALLVAEHESTGAISLSAFWLRRARRLLPALLSVMPAIALYCHFIAKTSELARIRADALATLAYVANWHTIFSHASYWDLFNAPSPLEHTWSLAIEEQFYVIWPLVVAAVLRLAGKRALFALTIALTLASMVAMVASFDPESPSRAYLGTDTRAAGILAGAALALVLRPGTRLPGRAVRVLDALGVLAIVGLGVAWARLDGRDSFLYRGGFWLTESLVLVLVANAISGSSSRVARALAWKPLTFVGTISYGLYLWHWPVNVLLTAERTHLHGMRLHALRFTITFAIAIVSYRFFERPIRMRTLSFGRPAWVIPGALAIAVFMIVRATDTRYRPAQPPPPAAALAPAPVEPEVILSRVLLLGDSTANSLGWALRGVRSPGVGIELKGLDGCAMLADMCGGEMWASLTNEMKPEVTIIELAGSFMHGISVDGQWRKACNPRWDEKFRTTLQKRVDALVSPTTAVWIATVPYPLGPWESTAFRDEVDCINVSIRAVAKSKPEVQVLDVASKLCPKGECEREFEGTSIRPDGVHFSIEGARGLARWVMSEVRK